MTQKPAPSHSVERHLRLEVGEYDRIIRTFIPSYDDLLDTVARAVAALEAPGLVIDLGGGTGGLTERVLERAPTRTLEVWDVDDAMLAVAGRRLARFGERAVLRHHSFDDVLPPCAAVVASLALHHVRDLGEKTLLYRRVHAALVPGGLFANADVTVPAEPEAARATYREWVGHMVACGISEADAWRNFDAWAEEDRYFSLEEELQALATAGFTHPQCLYRRGPATVTGAVTLDPP